MIETEEETILPNAWKTRSTNLEIPYSYGSRD